MCAPLVHMRMSGETHSRGPDADPEVERRSASGRGPNAEPDGVEDHGERALSWTGDCNRGAFRGLACNL